VVVVVVLLLLLAVLLVLMALLLLVLLLTLPAHTGWPRPPAPPAAATLSLCHASWTPSVHNKLHEDPCCEFLQSSLLLTPGAADEIGADSSKAPREVSFVTSGGDGERLDYQVAPFRLGADGVVDTLHTIPAVNSLL